MSGETSSSIIGGSFSAQTEMHEAEAVNASAVMPAITFLIFIFSQPFKLILIIECHFGKTHIQINYIVLFAICQYNLTNYSEKKFLLTS